MSEAVYQQMIYRAIPHRPPFLFIDAIVELRKDGVRATRTWDGKEFFYKGHYPGNPITPA